MSDIWVELGVKVGVIGTIFWIAYDIIAIYIKKKVLNVKKEHNELLTRELKIEEEIKKLLEGEKK